MTLSIIVALAAPGCSKNRVTPEQVGQMIQRELPVGSSVAQATSVLDAKGIEHSDLTDHVIYAIMRKTSYGFLIEGAITIKLRFDSTGKLVSHSVKEVFTGP